MDRHTHGRDGADGVGTGPKRSKVQRITDWFGLNTAPRFSIDFEESNYALIVARSGDLIRVIVGTASHVNEYGVGGTHVPMTLAQAQKLRDGLTRLLGDSDPSASGPDSDAPSPPEGP